MGKHSSKTHRDRANGKGDPQRGKHAKPDFKRTHPGIIDCNLPPYLATQTNNKYPTYTGGKR